MKCELFPRPGVPNLNGHIYPKDVLLEAIDNMKLPMPGVSIYTKSSATMDITRISHVVESVEVIDDKITADVRLLDTHEGRLVHSLIHEAGCPVYLGLRSLGKIKENTVTEMKIIGTSFHHGDYDELKKKNLDTK